MTPSPDRVQIPLYLTPKLLAELDAMAEERGVTRQHLLREAVEELLGYEWVRQRIPGRPGNSHSRARVSKKRK